MKKHVVKARLIIALTALVAFLSLFLTVSCAKWNKRNSEAESEVETEKIFLITDDTPNCSMTISDETFKYLNKNDDYSYILDLMDDYSDDDKQGVLVLHRKNGNIYCYERSGDSKKYLGKNDSDAAKEYVKRRFLTEKHSRLITD
ncbi:MAG: hypothetical protein IIY89_06845, partial [Clostridia bacterium]|nr:hypothetical protein [Clostridia bacterium]